MLIDGQEVNIPTAVLLTCHDVRVGTDGVVLLIQCSAETCEGDAVAKLIGDPWLNTLESSFPVCLEHFTEMKKVLGAVAVRRYRTLK